MNGNTSRRDTRRLRICGFNLVRSWLLSPVCNLSNYTYLFQHVRTNDWGRRVPHSYMPVVSRWLLGRDWTPLLLCWGCHIKLITPGHPFPTTILSNLHWSSRILFVILLLLTASSWQSIAGCREIRMCFVRFQSIDKIHNVSPAHTFPNLTRLVYHFDFRALKKHLTEKLECLGFKLAVVSCCSLIWYHSQ